MEPLGRRPGHGDLGLVAQVVERDRVEGGVAVDHAKRQKPAMDLEVMGYQQGRDQPPRRFRVARVGVWVIGQHARAGVL